MAIIQPFKGVRPGRDKAHLVVSRAVNTYKKNILNAKLEENPFTFLHIILPESGNKSTTKPNSKERFKLVKKKYEEFKKENILIQDKKPSLYIYRQIKDGCEYLGIVGAASVKDYDNGIIKIHEQTLTKREEVFTEYLHICGFNAEPVLLTYPDSDSIDKIIRKYTRTRAEYEFTTADRVSHLLWSVNDSADLSSLVKSFAKLDAVYIADGHHRSSSSSLLAKKINKNGNKKGMHNYFLSFFIAESKLKIYDFNRLVKDLKGRTISGFLNEISQNFDISEIDFKKAKPKSKHHFAFYSEGKWYHLKLKKGIIKTKDPLSNLDAEILNRLILEPVLGIKDLKTDERISFLGGNHGLSGLKKSVDDGKTKAAFALFPVSANELMKIADNKQIMPPKSTYIEPKLRSGLVIQQLFD
jgi:uncharacterized protein (DUF1015 family)